MTEYGSTFREAMKRSMEEPAAPFKPLNRVEPDMVRYSTLIIASVLILALGVGGVFMLDRVESHFRVKTAAAR